jgi:hypothetical protein
MSECNKIKETCHEYRILFVIAHKYYRGYESYLKHYLNNIHSFYKNSYALIVDNNSSYIEDVKEQIKDIENTELIINDSSQKFELGAYNYGIQYLINKNMINDFDYFVFTQDTFVLKNKYDFNNLTVNNVTACSLTTYYPDKYLSHIWEPILTKLDLCNNLDKMTFCWCVSFILSKSSIRAFHNLTKDAPVTIRVESEATERWLARILYHLNNNVNFNIDGDIRYLKYDCHSVNIYDTHPLYYFVKRTQRKTDTTQDK